MQDSPYHVEEERIMCALDSCVQVSVGADDAGGLAPQLKGDGLNPVGCLLHNQLAYLCAPSKSHLVNACKENEQNMSLYTSMLGSFRGSPIGKITTVSMLW